MSFFGKYDYVKITGPFKNNKEKKKELKGKFARINESEDFLEYGSITFIDVDWKEMPFNTDDVEFHIDEVRGMNSLEYKMLKEEEEEKE